MDFSDEGKAEIAAAVKILKDDGIHIHKTFAKFLAAKEDPDKKEDTTGKPPPIKDEPEAEPPRKPGLWWGQRT